MVDDITDYSEKFKELLNNTLFYMGPAITLWKQGKFDEVIQAPEVRQFLIDNEEHPATKVWRIYKTKIVVTSEMEDRRLIAGKIEEIKGALNEAERELSRYKAMIDLSTNEHALANCERIQEAMDVIDKQKENILEVHRKLDLQEGGSSERR